jgi:hypothetical protein
VVIFCDDRARMIERVVIDPHFRGPPGSANGGYACGLLATRISSPGAEVSLRSPPPLGRELELELEGDNVRLRDGETLVAEGHASDWELAIPDPPTLAQARGAAERYEWADMHPFPECFVCGPARLPPDGLGLLLGPVEGRDLYATPWTPGASLADERGAVPPILIWSALDCPTGVAVPEGRPSVLARLRGRLGAPLPVETECLVTSWVIGRDGRKHLGGAAITALDGTVHGVSEGLWIELRDPESAGAIVK